MQEKRFLSDNDMADFLCHVRQFVEVNCPPRSAIVKAFKVFSDTMEANNGPTWGGINTAYTAWLNTPAAEQQRILNGWRPAGVPVLADLVRDVTENLEGVSRVLTLDPGPGEIVFSTENVFDHGNVDPTRIHLAEGLTKEQAIAVLKLALAAVEAKWDEAVNLADDKYLVFTQGAAAARPFRRVKALPAAQAHGRATARIEVEELATAAA